MACNGAVCIEESPDKRVAKFTVNMQATSEQFGKSKANEIQVGSVSCGHTNQFLVAALDGVKCDIENISIDGRLSPDKLRTQKEFDEPLAKGLKWLMVKADAERMYPALPKLIQMARQAVGQVQNEESHFELMEHIQELAAGYCNRNEVPDWAAIEQQTSMSEPKWVSDIPALCAFVQAYGGGTSGQYLTDMIEFVRLCVPENRIVAGEFFEAWTKLKLSGDELCPTFVAASVKAHAKCPDDKVVGHVCCFITTSDITALGSGAKKRAMTDAEVLLKDFRNVLLKSKVDAEQRVLILGKFDMLVTRLVFGKSVPIEYKTIENTAYDFFEAVRAAATNFPKDRENPWKDTPPLKEKEKTGSSVVRSNVGLVQYDSGGIVRDAHAISLLVQGFKPEVRVKRADTTECDTVWKICAITDDGTVKMKEITTDGTMGKGVLSSKFDVFLQKYVATTDEHKVMDGWPEKNIDNDIEFKAVACAGAIQLGVYSIGQKHPAPQVTCKLKPWRGVFVAQTYGARTCILTHGTMKIGHQKATSDISSGAMAIKCDYVEGVVFYMNAPSSKDGMSPAWYVRRTDNADDVNAEIVYFAESVKIPKTMQKIEFEIPYIVNTRAIKAGDEIMLARVAKAKQPKGVKRDLCMSLSGHASKSSKHT